MISIYPDLEALSWAAAGLFLERAMLAIRERSRFSVALSGGSTPQRTYQLLAAPPFREQVPWNQVYIFWGDERCVPLDDPRSNANLAYENLLDRVPIPPRQINPITCAGNPEWGAQEYERKLEEFFRGQAPRFDLIFLGLGRDGHIASLFPGMPVLAERKRWVSDVYVPGQDSHRTTLTVPAINSAAAIVFLVSGEDKAEVLKRVHEPSGDRQRLPAQLVYPVDGELIWMADSRAATMLNSDQEGILG